MIQSNSTVGASTMRDFIHFTNYLFYQQLYVLTLLNRKIKTSSQQQRVTIQIEMTATENKSKNNRSWLWSWSCCRKLRIKMTQNTKWFNLLSVVILGCCFIFIFFSHNRHTTKQYSMYSDGWWYIYIYIGIHMWEREVQWGIEDDTTSSFSAIFFFSSIRRFYF